MNLLKQKFTKTRPDVCITCLTGMESQRKSLRLALSPRTPGAYENNPQRLRRCDDERPSYPGGRGAARRYPERKADAHGGAEARAYSAARGCRDALDRSRLIRQPKVGPA